jgi:2-octaprenyl-6-methoxyphenol hydroxylase
LNCDICIVGGGLVGLSAAIAFGQQGRSVKLLEARPLKNPENTGQASELDVRSIALSYSTVQIFRALGLWQGIADSAAPIKHIQVSSAGHFGVTRLAAKTLQLEAMGYVIEYDRLIEQLLSKALQQKNIEIITPARVESVIQQEQGVQLEYKVNDESHNLRTGLLIVAEGATSGIREKLGISIETVDYQQSALVANVITDVADSGVAYERFTSDGPMAMLPLTGSRYALVWTQPIDRVEQLLQLSDDVFLGELQKQFGYRLGLFHSVGQRGRFDLKLTRATQLVTDYVVLIGNAANSLHPVAGQGFNLALRDVGVLYDLLNGIDFEADQLLQKLDKYQLQRLPDQQQTVQLGHWLVKLFSNDLPVLNHLRSGALAALDISPWLKQEVSWRGMGYGHGLSSLMRGSS